MKKTILVVLMTMIISATCFAQEAEPEEISSLDGTYWDVQSILLFIEPSTRTFNLEIHKDGMGFYQKSIYGMGYWGRYIDLGVVSIGYQIFYNIALGVFFVAVIQPSSGWGVFTGLQFQLIPLCAWGCVMPYFKSEIGIMHKIIDNWTPPGVY